MLVSESCPKCGQGLENPTNYGCPVCGFSILKTTEDEKQFMEFQKFKKHIHTVFKEEKN